MWTSGFEKSLVHLTSGSESLAKPLYKAPKTCQNGDFWHVFAVFRYLIGPLVTKFFHILEEEVISFDLHGLTSKLDKNCLQK